VSFACTFFAQELANFTLPSVSPFAALPLSSSWANASGLASASEAATAAQIGFIGIPPQD
jgi:hypothetical protein